MSSWYRQIDAEMWGDEKFRRLSRSRPNGQFLWIYLLTGEHTDGLPGLYRVGEAALAEALGWSAEELRAVFAELETLRMALADVTARVIYLPNALRYQPPQNPKHIQGWGKTFRRIPECEMKDAWLQQLVELAHDSGGPYVQALIDGFDTVSDTVWHRVSPPNPNPHPNSKPHSNTSSVDLLRGVDRPPPLPEAIPYQEIMSLLNTRSGKRFRHGTAATRSHIKARWIEGYRLPDFKGVIDAKCGDWLGTDMEKYLRPQTLFGTKFESYVNEQPSNPGGTGSLYPDMAQLMEQSNGT